jgi:hypothetical protein
MRIKEIEGVEYVAKSDMEAAVKDRISKLSARAVQAEEMATALQTELDNQSGRLGSLDTLQAKITELETQLTDANTRYDRHNAMAQNGFTDPELREAVEWAYNKAMQGSEKPTPLADWLASIKADPTNAPLVLRPHLQTTPPPSVDPSTPSATPDAQPVAQTDTPALDVAPALLPPKTNMGAQPTPTQQGDILKNLATADLETYRANRDAARKAWFNR